jgi:hypothetical protein
MRTTANTRPRRAAAITVVLTAVLAASAAAPAMAQSPPVYRSPGYKGTTKRIAVRPAPTPPPISLSGKGQYQKVLVDAAGTAHIVWSEPNGDAADVVRYCRLKRGTRACDNPPATQQLIAKTSYGPGDGPQFDEDSNGPKVVSLGDQLIILSHRFPTPFARPVPVPGSELSTTTLMWVSEDGGNSFTGPAIVGTSSLGDAIVFGPPENPIIGTITDLRGDILHPTFFQAIRPGAYTSAKAPLGPDAIAVTSLGLEGGRPVAAINIGNQTIVRAWTGTGDPNDAATWSPPVTVNGADPSLASGPGGLFLGTINRSSERFEVRRIDGLAPRAPSLVGDRERVGSTDLFQDASGRLIAGWRTDSEVRLSTSSDGVRWSAAQSLLRAEPRNGPHILDVSAAADGGGLALVDVKGDGQEDQIAAVAFGATNPTGKLGLGHLAGTGGGDTAATTSCQKITFGTVDLRSAAGCFLKGTGDNARTTVSTGSVLLNGLEIVPDAGVQVQIDARKHTLNTTGKVSVTLRVPNVPPITLWHGELHVKLDDPGSGSTLFDFDTRDFAAVLKGFPIDGHITVRLQGDGVVIPVSLQLPKYFGGISGAATIRADQRTGVHLDSLKIHVDQAFIGPLEIRPLDVSYRSNGEVWEGAADLFIPGPLSPHLHASVRFEGNAFRRGDISLDINPGITVFSGVFLHEIGLGLELSPTKISGRAVLGALFLPPRSYTIDLTGSLFMQFGEGADPTIIRAGGNLTVVGVSIANAEFVYSSLGYATFNVQVGLPTKTSPVRVGGSALLYVNPPHFGGKVTGEACFLGCFSVAAAISDRGIAGCADETNGPGVVYRWGQGADGSLTTCYISDILDVPPGAGARARARAAQATGGRTFVVGPGEPGETLQVVGAGGPPAVTLVAPDGRRLTPAPVTDRAAAVIGGVPDGTNTLYIGLRKPAPGTWTVEPAAGSPAIEALKQARGLAPPRVTARMEGRGDRRTLAYSISGPAGTSVQFVESAAAGLRPIGGPRSGSGRLSFTPAPGGGRRRTILAAVSVGGIAREQRTVATFTAPPAVRPGQVRGVRVVRRGAAVTVRFARTRGAARYIVQMTDADGVRRLAIATASGRGARFTGVRRGRVRVAVRAVTVTGRRGPVVRRTFR